MGVYNIIVVLATLVSIFNNNCLVHCSVIRDSEDADPIHVNVTFPEVCPLGELLRSGNGDKIKCNCPPHPFCPLLYYCKIVEHGQAGICCPDFRVKRRHHIKPEESRLLSNRRFQTNATIPCESCIEPGTETRIESNELPKTSKDVGVGSPGMPLMPGNKADEKDEVSLLKLKKDGIKCKPILEIDYPELPSSVCTYLESNTDSDGCPQLPNIVCLPPKMCPEIKNPGVPPNCKLDSVNLDENDCPLPRGIICTHTTKPMDEPVMYPRAPASRPKITKNQQPEKPAKATTPTPRTASPSPPPCPYYPLPPTLSPDCRVAALKKDARGCYLPPEIVCEKRATAYYEIIEENVPDIASEKIVSDYLNENEKRKCPKILTPVVQPGCRLLDPKYDDKGCMLLPEVTCDPRIIARMCSPLILPKMNPLCTFGSNRNDSTGCPMIPEIICPVPMDDMDPITKIPAETVTVRGVQPKVMSHCPYIPPPFVPIDCFYGPAKYDDKGCFLEPEVICPEANAIQAENTENVDDIVEKNEIKDEELEPALMSVPDPETTPNPDSSTTTDIVLVTKTKPMGFTRIPDLVPYTPPKKMFKDMLTPEFYHIVQTNIPPDAGIFRRAIAIPVTTSGRFYSCNTHSDCFHLREPREWCDTGSPDSDAVWTDKSCHCSEDTLVPACVVERGRRNFIEWTFCADYFQCVEREWQRR